MSRGNLEERLSGADAAIGLGEAHPQGFLK